jgi:OB-fold nucleic acid binding domain
MVRVTPEHVLICLLGFVVVLFLIAAVLALQHVEPRPFTGDPDRRSRHRSRPCDRRADRRSTHPGVDHRVLVIDRWWGNPVQPSDDLLGVDGARPRPREGRRVSVAGLVLVRQRPGSANGVLFITLDDETEIANLIIWPSVFERQRRLILSASMIGCRGKVQREGEVIHVIAEHLTDLSQLLRGVGEREEALPLPHGQGDEAKHGSGSDARQALGQKPRDIYIPDLRIEAAINVKTRDFR